MAQETIGKSKEIALLSERDISDAVMARMRKVEQGKMLVMPKNYVPENAIKSMYLQLLQTVDKDKRPALSVCTKESVANTFLDMVLQGLNPVKKQCYPIVRGNMLTLSRSYFGVEVALRNVLPAISRIPVQIVYADDEFEYEIINDPEKPELMGNIVVTKHKQTLKNRDKQKIIGVYGYVMYKPSWSDKEQLLASDLMTIEEIHTSWMQSQMSVFDDKGNVKPSAVHGKFAEEMSKKTFISRLCKRPFNTSNDNNMLNANQEAFVRTTENEYLGDPELEAEFEKMPEGVSQQTIEQNPADQPKPEPKGGLAAMFS